MSFVPPPYPYDRLNEAIAIATKNHGEIVDLSIGAPCDPPSQAVMDAFADPTATKSYPASIGSRALLESAAGWMNRRLGVSEYGALAACVGTKEFVALLPQLLSLRDPSRDTVLYPAISYPTYAMGATLGRCRSVAVEFSESGDLDLDSVSKSDIDRALCLWVNSPSNPTGDVLDLGLAAEWGRENGIPVFSDECYVEFSWGGPPQTILQHGTQGVMAVHSLSKRSNFAGGRIGFYAGDSDLVHYLSETRKHIGMMPTGPSQKAAIVAFDDDSHVDEQRERYLNRLRRLAALMESLGIEADVPQGGFYLWVRAPGDDAWQLTNHLAESIGMIVSPGEFYGESGAPFVRIAAVQPDEQIDILESRQRCLRT